MLFERRKNISVNGFFLCISLLCWIVSALSSRSNTETSKERNSKNTKMEQRVQLLQGSFGDFWGSSVNTKHMYLWYKIVPSNENQTICGLTNPFLSVRRERLGRCCLGKSNKKLMMFQGRLELSKDVIPEKRRVMWIWRQTPEKLPRFQF